MKKWLIPISCVLLLAATSSPYRVYELLVNKGVAWIDAAGNSSFETLTLNDVEFDLSDLDTGEVLTFDGTDIVPAAASSGSWLSLTDTPDSYVANKLVRVNSGATALELVDSFATTEAALELQLTDVTNVFTNNDGALNDDNLSNNTLASLGTSTLGQLNTLIADTVWTTAVPPTILALSDVPDAYDTGKYLKSTGSGFVLDTPAGAGTVTSVEFVLTDGLEGTGTNPITDSGALTLGLNYDDTRDFLDIENLSGSDIETLFNSQVPTASEAEALAGTETSVRQWSPELVAIAASGTVSPLFSDADLIFYNGVDPTKKVTFNLANLGTGEEWIITWPDGDVDFRSLDDTYVSNTLTSSKFIGSGSTTNAVDLGTAEVAGALPNSNLTSMASGTIKGRVSTSGAPQDLTVGQVNELLANLTPLTSSSASVAWNGENVTRFSHTMTENTTIADMTGTEKSTQLVLFIITQMSPAKTLAWNAEFVAADGLNASIPAPPTVAGDMALYGFIRIGSQWFLIAYQELTP